MQGNETGLRFEYSFVHVCLLCTAPRYQDLPFKSPFVCLFAQYLGISVVFQNYPNQWVCAQDLFLATGSSSIIQLTAVAL